MICVNPLTFYEHHGSSDIVGSGEEGDRIGEPPRCADALYRTRTSRDDAVETGNAECAPQCSRTYSRMRARTARCGEHTHGIQ